MWVVVYLHEPFMCTHTHTHAHTCAHTNMHTHKYTHTCTHTHTHTHTHSVIVVETSLTSIIIECRLTTHTCVDKLPPTLSTTPPLPTHTHTHMYTHTHTHQAPTILVQSQSSDGDYSSSSDTLRPLPPSPSRSPRNSAKSSTLERSELDRFMVCTSHRSGMTPSLNVMHLGPVLRCID